MVVNGKDLIQVFDGTDWKTIDAGAAFPDDPESGDYFQLTKAIAPTTTVKRSQTLTGTSDSLTVRATLGFFPGGGTFTIDGMQRHVQLQLASPGVPDAPGVITGINGCKGRPRTRQPSPSPRRRR